MCKALGSISSIEKKILCSSLGQDYISLFVDISLTKWFIWTNKM
jgi:hypothetical protein